MKKVCQVLCVRGRRTYVRYMCTCVRYVYVCESTISTDPGSPIHHT